MLVGSSGLIAAVPLTTLLARRRWRSACRPRRCRTPASTATTFTSLGAMRLTAVLLFCAMAASACGGGGDPDPVAQVPAGGGQREAVRAATQSRAADFPAVEGRTLQEVADGLDGTGPDAVMASSVFRTGENRLAFGEIDGETNRFVYGKTAIYVARTPDGRAKGPYAAPADLLLTKPAFRSRQAATEGALFAAVYAADVTFDRPGVWSILAVTEVDGKRIGSPLQVEVLAPGKDLIPDVGERAPKVETDTVASARGDVESIDTRVPPSDMHARSFADVAGKKPVALLFATPQLCQSRVCGPVVDIAAQLKSKYGDRMEFIHQEVYVDNALDKGLRPPLARFNLQSEPWLFVVGRDGRVTRRLEGSFGLSAFEEAIRTAL